MATLPPCMHFKDHAPVVYTSGFSAITRPTPKRSESFESLLSLNVLASSLLDDEIELESLASNDSRLFQLQQERLFDSGPGSHRLSHSRNASNATDQSTTQDSYLSRSGTYSTRNTSNGSHIDVAKDHGADTSDVERSPRLGDESDTEASYRTPLASLAPESSLSRSTSERSTLGGVASNSPAAGMKISQWLKQQVEEKQRLAALQRANGLPTEQNSFIQTQPQHVRSSSTPAVAPASPLRQELNAHKNAEAGTEGGRQFRAQLLEEIIQDDFENHQRIGSDARKGELWHPTEYVGPVKRSKSSSGKELFRRRSGNGVLEGWTSHRGNHSESANTPAAGSDQSGGLAYWACHTRQRGASMNDLLIPDTAADSTASTSVPPQERDKPAVPFNAPVAPPFNNMVGVVEIPDFTTSTDQRPESPRRRHSRTTSISGLAAALLNQRFIVKRRDTKSSVNDTPRMNITQQHHRSVSPSPSRAPASLVGAVDPESPANWHARSQSEGAVLDEVGMQVPYTAISRRLSDIPSSPRTSTCLTISDEEPSSASSHYDADIVSARRSYRQSVPIEHFPMILPARAVVQRSRSEGDKLASMASQQVERDAEYRAKMVHKLRRPPPPTLREPTVPEHPNDAVAEQQ